MANGIDRVHKLGKHNKKIPDINNNMITFPVSISKCHNTKDEMLI